MREVKLDFEMWKARLNGWERGGLGKLGVGSKSKYFLLL